MVLSDRSIRQALDAGKIVIDPFDESCIQPSSVDLHVDQYFRLFRNHTSRVIDVRENQEDLTELVDTGEEPLILHPGEFVLGSTKERVTLPIDLVARLEGKSSLGRLGLLIHSTAGDGEHHHGDAESYGESDGHCVPPRWLLKSNKAGGRSGRDRLTSGSCRSTDWAWDPTVPGTSS